MAGLIIKLGKPMGKSMGSEDHEDEEEDSEMSSEAAELAAEDVLSAIQKKDAKALAMAMRTLIDCC